MSEPREKVQDFDVSAGDAVDASWEVVNVASYTHAQESDTFSVDSMNQEEEEEEAETLAKESPKDEQSVSSDRQVREDGVSSINAPAVQPQVEYAQGDQATPSDDSKDNSISANEHVTESEDALEDRGEMEHEDADDVAAEVALAAANAAESDSESLRSSEKDTLSGAEPGSESDGVLGQMFFGIVIALLFQVLTVCFFDENTPKEEAPKVRRISSFPYANDGETIIFEHSDWAKSPVVAAYASTATVHAGYLLFGSQGRFVVRRIESLTQFSCSAHTFGIDPDLPEAMSSHDHRTHECRFVDSLDPALPEKWSGKPWAHLCNLNEACTSPDAGRVRFGNSARWISKQVDGGDSFNCTGEFFGASLQGLKDSVSCDFQATNLAFSQDGFLPLCREFSECLVRNVAGLVRYGTNGKYVFRHVGPGTEFRCVNSFFGHDPAHGVEKRCDFKQDPQSAPRQQKSDDEEELMALRAKLVLYEEEFAASAIMVEELLARTAELESALASEVDGKGKTKGKDKKSNDKSHRDKKAGGKDKSSKKHGKDKSGKHHKHGKGGHDKKKGK
ncbi:Hypothetical Protein FCC1311_103392 [Hondaea fermentalgiana]|uniref:Uncharacterized protein n=1 Tax=Hondaea fermentalgiana TaxID=2315210 RepID=A0A2R5GTC0_9STRA|nr:Hypothetical Protein FCC1311_103392 [Hondaea fermentalgiana]|eukprot:GBG34116.1 Hypothetical Protein FCC1311_103392 [Hondaea fermentalgiana]